MGLQDMKLLGIGTQVTVSGHDAVVTAINHDTVTIELADGRKFEVPHKQVEDAV
jgi:preprotein translocase subunit YajC